MGKIMVASPPGPTEAAKSLQPTQLQEAPFPDMAWIPGGTFLMGSKHHYPEEAPVHEETVGAFWMDQHLVTNDEFRTFVEATRYVTIAERVPDAAQYPGALP